MIRRLIRPGAALGAVLASLALASSALAAPSTPQLAPLPYLVCGSSLNVAWSPSTPDPGAHVIAYRLDLGDLTAGTATYKYAAGTATSIGPLAAGHHYVLRLRALEMTANHALVPSASDADTFVRACLPIAEISQRYVAYNPFPECIMCGGLLDLYKDDPIEQRLIATATPPAAEKIAGVQLDGKGGAIVVNG